MCLIKLPTPNHHLSKAQTTVLTSQRGFAVVMVLSVLAILLLLMATVMSRNSQLQFRTIGLVHQQQAKAHIIGAEAWAMEILQKDKQDNDYDDVTEIWAQQIPFVPIEGGGITGQIKDLSGMLFVNNLLVGDQADSVWIKLLEELIKQQEGSGQLVNHLIDWVDTNVETPSFNLEDAYYSSLALPYRSANQAMVDVTELKLVQGFNNELVNALKNSLFAIPLKPDNNVKINLNTAPEEVLEAVVTLLGDPQISLDVLLDKRPWENIGDLPLTPIVGETEANEQAEMPLNRGNFENYLSVKSELFLLDSKAIVGAQTSRLLSVIRRPVDSGPVMLLQRQWLPGD